MCTVHQFNTLMHVLIKWFDIWAGAVLVPGRTLLVLCTQPSYFCWRPCHPFHQSLGSHSLWPVSLFVYYVLLWLDQTEVIWVNSRGRRGNSTKYEDKQYEITASSTLDMVCANSDEVNSSDEEEGKIGGKKITWGKRTGNGTMLCRAAGWSDATWCDATPRTAGY